MNGANSLLLVRFLVSLSLLACLPGVFLGGDDKRSMAIKELRQKGAYVTATKDAIKPLRKALHDLYGDAYLVQLKPSFQEAHLSLVLDMRPLVDLSMND